jgi:hypothetical protein
MWAAWFCSFYPDVAMGYEHTGHCPACLVIPFAAPCSCDPGCVGMFGIQYMNLHVFSAIASSFFSFVEDCVPPAQFLLYIEKK